MQTQESAQHQGQELIKIGMSWFKPSICPLLQQHQWLQSYIENIESFGFNALHYNTDGRLVSSPIKITELFKHMEKTYIKKSYGISPKYLAHINFKNLQFLNIFGSSISSIESIQSIDLSHLKHLALNQENHHMKKWSIQIKSIKPLVKTNMPSLKSLDLRDFALEHLQRELPRVKTSKHVQCIYFKAQRSTHHQIKSYPLIQLQFRYKALCLKYEPNKTNYCFLDQDRFEDL